MKKVLFAVTLMLTAFSTNMNADDSKSAPAPIVIPISGQQGNQDSGRPQRSLIIIPEVYLDVATRTLFFAPALYDSSINIVSPMAGTVYSAVLPDGTVEFSLPSLQGEFELQIIIEDNVFTGIIEL